MEACIRSLHRSIVMRELTSARGLNVQSECQKIKGVSALAIEASSFGGSPFHADVLTVNQRSGMMRRTSYLDEIRCMITLRVY
jgi:hypothetical protein